MRIMYILVEQEWWWFSLVTSFFVAGVSEPYPLGFYPKLLAYAGSRWAGGFKESEGGRQMFC